jgi:hypothetical protein
MCSDVEDIEETVAGFFKIFDVAGTGVTAMPLDGGCRGGMLIEVTEREDL